MSENAHPLVAHTSHGGARLLSVDERSDAHTVNQNHNYVFQPTILNPLLMGYHSLLGWLHNRPIQQNWQMGRLKSGVRDMIHSGKGNLSVYFQRGGKLCPLVL